MWALRYLLVPRLLALLLVPRLLALLLGTGSPLLQLLDHLSVLHAAVGVLQRQDLQLFMQGLDLLPAECDTKPNA